MSITIISVWDGVPETDHLRALLETVKDKSRASKDRTDAKGQLVGHLKVLRTYPSRSKLVAHIEKTLKGINTYG